METYIPTNLDNSNIIGQRNNYTRTKNIVPTSNRPIWIQWIAYILVVIIVILIILLFVNYTITPIFQLHPGGSGIIPIPGFDDGEVFWQTGNIGEIPDKSTLLASSTSNHTLLLDIFIQNPMMFSAHPRLIFYRGNLKPDAPTSNTLIGVLSNYNVAMALAPDTNDLIVSILNADNIMENALLTNVPVQSAFRIGVVIMDKAMEVYLNGNLMRTRTFQTGPKHVLGNFYPPEGSNSSIALVQNLHIWNRVLTSSEIRSAIPAIGIFNSQPPSTMCSAYPSNQSSQN